MATADQQRQGLLDLSDLAEGELTAVLGRLQGLPAEQVRDALMDILPALGDAYGDSAAVLAAQWYDEARAAAAVRGRFTADLAKAPTRARWQALARWGVDPLFAADPDWSTMVTLIVGGFGRTISDRHRLTIVENAVRDPQSSGWQRITRPGACGFCRMLHDRGYVYTDDTVTFRSHDHCRCAASPSWAKNVVKVSREPYRQSQRNRSEAQKKADNERARAYIAEHYGSNS